jgi:hypothetical protein
VRRLLALAVVVAGILTACGSGLQFRADQRLSFRVPTDRQRVAVPFTVEWSMRDFRAVGLDGSADPGRGAYAVFLDRAPMPAGKDLKWLVRDDDACTRDPRCPNAQYLADRGVSLTTDTKVVIRTLARADVGVGDEKHHVNVVLLDGKGRRIGESAWYRQFRTNRRAQ